MNNRKEQLVSILKNQGGWITARELSKILNVSDRTIRSDVNTINSNTVQPLIESSIRQGYRIEPEQMTYTAVSEKNHSSIPQTPNERKSYIIKQLLVCRDRVHVNRLLNDLYISEYTLENDLKSIRKAISSYPDLEIQRSGDLLSLQGPEESIRELYKIMMLDETHRNFLNINEIASMYTNFDLLKCKYILETILEAHNYSVDDSSFPSLILHVGISVDRIINGKYVQSSHSTEAVYDSEEFKIAIEFFQRISKLYQTHVADSEAAQLALLLMGKKGSAYNDAQLIGIADINAKELVTDLIQYIDQQYGINFSNDEVLKVGLALHLQSLVERSHKNINAANLYLQEIKRKFPLIFELGVTSANYLSERLNIPIVEDEIGFIALHLGMAYKRLEDDKLLRAVLIMPKTQAITDSILQRMNLNFSEYMTVVEAFDYFEESKILRLHPDLIICSVPLQHNLPIPTVQISIFLSREDEAKIFSVLNNIEQKRLKDEYSEYLREMIRPQHFYKDMVFDSREEILRFLSDDLYHSLAVSKDFYSSLLKRESMSPTSFSCGFAIPHPVNHTVLQSNISVMILRKPVQWGSYEVRIIFLLAVEKMESQAVKPFFDWMTNLSNNVDQLSALIESKTYQEFISKMF